MTLTNWNRLTPGYRKIYPIHISILINSQIIIANDKKERTKTKQHPCKQFENKNK